MPSQASSASHSDRQHMQVTAREKTDAVLRLLKGESVVNISQELGVSVSRIERWQSSFLAAGAAELSKRKDDPWKGWAAKYSVTTQQWIWLVLALVTIVSVIV